MPPDRRLFRLRRGDVRADVDDEIAFHLAMRARDLAAEGVSGDGAERAAADAFGDVATVRAACITIDERRLRREERVEYMADLWQDLRFAVRSLRAAPLFTLTALACVALGIGLTTAIFSLVDAALVRPLPYASPDRLVAVYAQRPQRGERGVNVSYPDYASWRDESRSFSALGIWTWSSHALSGAGGAAERVEGAELAPSVVPILGVRPIVGRAFTADEARPGRERVALLGYDLWQRRYGGDRSIVGRGITIDARPYVVVGVMPRGFAFPERGELWVPFAVDAAREERGNRPYAGAVGRLRDGVTLAQARADLATISSRLAAEFPTENREWAAELVTLREDTVGPMRRPLLVFLGAAGFVLLIACANVANLMIARGAARRRELAIRTAIGAGGGRLVRQVLTECALVALAGGVAGVALAALLVGLLRAALADVVPSFLTFGVDLRAAAFALALSLATGLAFGALPARRAGRLSLANPLRESSRGSSAGVDRARARNTLVVAELALSLVLMVGAGLFVRSYQAIAGTSLGFREAGVLTARVALPYAKYAEPARRRAFYDALLARLGALGGVTHVGAAQGIPFSGWNVQGGMTVEGRPAPKPGDEIDAHFQAVTPAFFDALGATLARGRPLTAQDRDTANIVGLVNETFARRMFGSADPLGHRVRVGGPRSPWITIVGVLRDYRHYRLPEPMGPALYFPYATAPEATMTLAVRTTLADPLALVPAVRAAVRDLDPDVPLYTVRTLEAQVSRTLWRQRLQGQVFAGFAAFALLLAVVGIYGVVSYAVAQRTRELGVRVALGATRRQLFGLVLGQGARLAAAGVVLGLIGAFALVRLVASLLYGVGAFDPLTFVAVPVALGAATLLAVYTPARRATRVDPLAAMRDS